MTASILRLPALLALVAMSACAPAPPPASVPAPPRPAPVALGAGLERVMGQDARALQALFGAPDLDVREGPARKLQYASAVCVLDAYLYPPGPSREPIVRYLDARRPTGDDFDRASCIAALSRRAEAR